MIVKASIRDRLGLPFLAYEISLVNRYDNLLPARRDITVVSTCFCRDYD